MPAQIQDCKSGAGCKRYMEKNRWKMTLILPKLLSCFREEEKSNKKAKKRRICDQIASEMKGKMEVRVPEKMQRCVTLCSAERR